MGDFDVNPTLSVGATIFTAVTTLGLALLFGRSRARQFIELEIEEGVRKTTQAAEPKRWLHWLAFLFGMLAVSDTWLEANGSEDGIVSNFFFEGLINIFGPFALWIGGALLLGRIGARGPQIMQLIFGRTPLLKDVKRGLKGSGSAESVNRLAVIMLLTLSIVTLAAVQGYTGTLVDEKTVDATVGSDLKIIVEQPLNETAMLGLVGEFTTNSVTPVATTVPRLVWRTAVAVTRCRHMFCSTTTQMSCDGANKHFQGRVSIMRWLHTLQVALVPEKTLHTPSTWQVLDEAVTKTASMTCC